MRPLRDDAFKAQPRTRTQRSSGVTLGTTGERGARRRSVACQGPRRRAGRARRQSHDAAEQQHTGSCRWRWGKSERCCIKNRAGGGASRRRGGGAQTNEFRRGPPPYVSRAITLPDMDSGIFSSLNGARTLCDKARRVARLWPHHHGAGQMTPAKNPDRNMTFGFGGARQGSSDARLNESDRKTRL
jgi:hypothetical protein